MKQQNPTNDAKIEQYLEEGNLRLFEKMLKGKASSREIFYLSFSRGMITEEQYLDYLQIEKDCEEFPDEDCDLEDEFF